MRKPLPLTVLSVLAAAVIAAAQAPQGRLTIDLIYDPATRVNFSGTPPADLTWIDNDRYLWVRRGEGGVDWLSVDAASGSTSPVFDSSRMDAALAATPGVSREDARAQSRSPLLILNPGRTAALMTIADDLFYYDFTANSVRRLTNASGTEEEASFSPDGKSVAFVRSNNLYAVSVGGGAERALTTDGTPQILNGKLDWLYQEEIYGRGRFRAYWWSPDSSRLAFLRLDERPVPEYTVVDHIPYRPVLEVTDYPKAGDANPLVKVGVARVGGGGGTVWIDTTAYADDDMLVVNVDWMPDSRYVVHQIQNREQTWLDLRVAEAANGRPRTILRETTPAWVNENGNPVWLKDGSFLWISERTGFRHVYQYRPDGALIRPVTSGRWDVRSLYGVDEAGGAIYIASIERSAIGVDIYRAALDGSARTLLLQKSGTHRASFNPAFTQFIDVWSDINTPSQVRLHHADGREVRVIEANPVRALSEYRLSTPEFIQIKARDGYVLDGVLIKPPDFNPARRYPVYQFTYAGPGAGVVRDRWAGTQHLFHQLLAQHDIVVFMLDNRSAGGKGAESQWPVHGRLGEMELQDLEDGAAWLRQQPFIDGSRVLLSGWSYGGFMTAYALTHSTSWAAGIVGAPVSDWRDYDTIYTERLMKLPRNNPDGYRRTAPRFAADKLHGRILLIHGTMDDNVHMQNSVQFAYELQRAGKLFEFMTYAKSRHGFTDARLIKHLQQSMFDFVQRSVGSGAAAPASH
jgi:dipeptidyl-peptidase-4